MNKILFIGNIQHAQSPTGGGAQARNQIFLDHLKNNFEDITYIDTWKKNRLISFLSILFRILISPNTKIILSLSYDGLLLLSKVLCFLHLKRKTYYWVVGGDLIHKIKQSNQKAIQYLRYHDHIIVQANYMANDLIDIGFENVKTVRNFKKIPSIKRKSTTGKKIKFVFLGRLIEEKGVGLIIEAARKLSKYDFQIDFFGPHSKQYDSAFFDNLKQKNVAYRGFLDLTCDKGYEVLASYDVMVFPTFFEGEGFPGVFIDAFISGLPIVTTNFHANSEVVTNGENGLIIPANDVDALYQTMKAFLIGKHNLVQLKKNAQAASLNYDVKNVLNKTLFEEIGLTTNSR